MIRVGITGQSGFIGSHLYNTIALEQHLFELVPFNDNYFNSLYELSSFVKNCDVIIHLAAVNRSTDAEELYRTNIALVESLISAMEAENVKPLVVFSSSIQEKLDNPYGRSKVQGRLLLENWATKNNSGFISLIVPNVFGPFCRPNYNSFIATFSWRLTHGELPEIINDSVVKLIYVDSLCAFIIRAILENYKNNLIESLEVPFDFEYSVSTILNKLVLFRDLYYENGIIPSLVDRHDVALFNTFRSYINFDEYFPRKLVKNIDARGTFIETIRLGVGGQVSFSTTVPGITRGNHYHTRKIERFTVMKGIARIELRKIGSSEVLSYILDGQDPAYVDMPVWYTHNITNIGTEELFTQFWINEWFNELDPDTYFEKV